MCVCVCACIRVPTYFEYYHNVNVAVVFVSASQNLRFRIVFDVYSLFLPIPTRVYNTYARARTVLLLPKL